MMKDDLTMLPRVFEFNEEIKFYRKSKTYKIFQPTNLQFPDGVNVNPAFTKKT